MFAYLKGTLVEVESQQKIVVDVQGVGYLITVPTSLISKLPPRGNEIKVYVYLGVRQDGMELYGFLSREDKLMFEKLISVSGIGPKAAISIMSALTSTQLALAIATGDVKTLSTAPGVGKKTSQRIILELKEKIEKEALDTLNVSVELPAEQGMEKEAVQALMALGYQTIEARQAVIHVKDQAQDTAELVRLALKALDKR
ncbi:MAG: Holliday junction branch migration protein RuvA [Clostridiales bacterium]|jgi:Holliday junction DNA helicase RuvA|nr:Holliday junction branch migration protein RuvA [Clostridiales bacterium]